MNFRSRAVRSLGSEVGMKGSGAGSRKSRRQQSWEVGRPARKRSVGSLVPR